MMMSFSGVSLVFFLGVFLWNGSYLCEASFLGQDFVYHGARRCLAAPLVHDDPCHDLIDCALSLSELHGQFVFFLLCLGIDPSHLPEYHFIMHPYLMVFLDCGSFFYPINAHGHIMQP